MASNASLFDFTKPKVMGVLNITPNSFCPKGRYYQAVDEAIEHALAMVTEGADIIDIGGESTRPGTQPVSPQEELDRVIPVIEKLSSVTDIPLSVDTSQPMVIEAAAQAGVALINDVRGLRLPGALEAVASANIPVCLMHMRFLEGHSTQIPEYALLDEIKVFFDQRIRACQQAGIAKEKIILDPGFGTGTFGKSLEDNLQLLAQLNKLKSFGLPILVGLSRKTFIYELLDLPVAERMPASLVAAVLAVSKGANIVRVHDVKETVEALRLLSAVEAFGQNDE